MRVGEIDHSNLVVSIGGDAHTRQGYIGE